MNNLLLADLKLYLLKLVDPTSPEHAALLRLTAGSLFLGRLQKHHDEIEALPLPTEAARANADELKRLDAVHDGYYRAAYHLLSAYEAHPELPDDLRAALPRLRAALLPDLSATNATYATEAAKAADRERRAAELAPDLARFPVVDGHLGDWLHRNIVAGHRIGDLLHGRAHAELPSLAPAAPASVLRSRVLGTLALLRDTARLELDARPELPRDLENVLFGYIDSLAQGRT